MKEILKKLFILLLSICSLSSCNGQTSERKVKHNNDMKNLTLIFSVSGGTRAHIISINSENELSYRVGSFYVNDSLNEPKIKYNDDYKEIIKTLSEVEAKRIRDYYLNKNSLSFIDTKVVKDSWEYYLYINGKRIAFGRKFNFDDFPVKLKESINYILDVTGKLYDIPGMS
jgi:hypothetical protein